MLSHNWLDQAGDLLKHGQCMVGPWLILEMRDGSDENLRHKGPKM